MLPLNAVSPVSNLLDLDKEALPLVLEWLMASGLEEVTLKVREGCLEAKRLSEFMPLFLFMSEIVVFQDALTDADREALKSVSSELCSVQSEREPLLTKLSNLLEGSECDLEQLELCAKDLKASNDQLRSVTISAFQTVGKIAPQDWTPFQETLTGVLAELKGGPVLPKSSAKVSGALGRKPGPR